LVSGDTIKAVLFNPETRERDKPALTGKEVEAAIKTGTVTPQMLQAEINRLNEREARSVQLDRQKVQVAIHQQFSEQLKELNNNMALTETDTMAARFIVYQSLDYTTRREVKETLFPTSESDDESEDKSLLELLGGLSEQQYSFLIRTAIAAKPESKYPNSETAECLYRLAESTGVNVAAIEQKQQTKVAERQEKLSEKVYLLERKMKKTKSIV
jgi:hypothetical protein